MMTFRYSQQKNRPKFLFVAFQILINVQEGSSKALIEQQANSLECVKQLMQKYS